MSALWDTVRCPCGKSTDEPSGFCSVECAVIERLDPHEAAQARDEAMEERYSHA